jgi:parallel beta-helix repeat protein
MTGCGTASNPYDTDGNNIILDTLSNSFNSFGPYTGGVLVAFNVTYNSGGGGVHVFESSNVTVANNTCFNNYLDPYNSGSARACIDGWGGGNSFFNNIAVAIPAAHTSCDYNVAPMARWNYALGATPETGAKDIFERNITDLFGGNMSCYDEVMMWDNNAGQYSTAQNKMTTDPMWVDVGSGGAGTETTPPVGVNFALKTGSPAVNYGLTKSYLSPQSVDVGACFHTLSTCP